MSTDKFHINDAAPGNDTHSNFLRRMGYGDLLNRPGRQEMTIDTASMYKSAAVGQGEALGAGLGAVAGGIGGVEVAKAMGGSATAKLLGALTGAGLGGVGGYYAGGLLDEPGKDGVSPMLKMRREALTVGGAGLGGLTGYGISKYLVGSKNKTHHLLSALVGAGLGGGAGYLVAGDKTYSDQYRKGLDIAKEQGLDESKHKRFAQLYAKNAVNQQPGWFNRNFTIHPDRSVAQNLFMVSETDPTKRALAELNGEKDPLTLSETKATASVLTGLGLGYGAEKGFEYATRNTNMGKNHTLRRNLNKSTDAIDDYVKATHTMYDSTTKSLINIAKKKPSPENIKAVLNALETQGELSHGVLKHLIKTLGVTDEASALKILSNNPNLLGPVLDTLKHGNDTRDFSKLLKFWKLFGKPVTRS